MSPFRKLLLVGVGLAMVHGLQACAGETELNPQPLPPEGTNTPTPGADQKGDTTGAGGSSGSSGSSGATPSADADAGSDAAADGGGDAADAGDR